MPMDDVTVSRRDPGQVVHKASCWPLQLHSAHPLTRYYAVRQVPISSAKEVEVEFDDDVVIVLKLSRDEP